MDQTFGMIDELLLSLCDLLLTPRAVHCGESSVQYIRSLPPLPQGRECMYSSSRTTRDTELNDRDGCRGDHGLSGQARARQHVLVVAVLVRRCKRHIFGAHGSGSQSQWQGQHCTFTTIAAATAAVGFAVHQVNAILFRGHGQESTVGGKCHTANEFRTVGIGPCTTHLVRIPHTHHGIGTSRGQLLSIRGPGHCVNGSRVRRIRRHQPIRIFGGGSCCRRVTTKNNVQGSHVIGACGAPQYQIFPAPRFPGHTFGYYNRSILVLRGQR